MGSPETAQKLVWNFLVIGQKSHLAPGAAGRVGATLVVVRRRRLLWRPAREARRVLDRAEDVNAGEAGVLRSQRLDNTAEVKLMQEALKKERDEQRAKWRDRGKQLKDADRQGAHCRQVIQPHAVVLLRLLLLCFVVLLLTFCLPASRS